MLQVGQKESYQLVSMTEKLEDTKEGITRCRNSNAPKKNAKKERSTKHYAYN